MTNLYLTIYLAWLVEFFFFYNFIVSHLFHFSRFYGVMLLRMLHFTYRPYMLTPIIVQGWPSPPNMVQITRFSVVGFALDRTNHLKGSVGWPTTPLPSKGGQPSVRVVEVIVQPPLCNEKKRLRLWGKKK
jgi:hypothetical protein